MIPHIFDSFVSGRKVKFHLFVFISADTGLSIILAVTTKSTLSFFFVGSGVFYLDDFRISEIFTVAFFFGNSAYARFFAEHHRIYRVNFYSSISETVRRKTNISSFFCVCSADTGLFDNKYGICLFCREI